MIVVSNTTPIHYLIRVEEIEVTRELFGHIIIPQAVLDEMQREKTPEAVKAWVGALPAWLEVRQANTAIFQPRRKIGAGEREAIALAIEFGADTLLIDDRDGIKEAHECNIFTIGTLALLKQAADKGILDISEAIDRLAQTNFRMPPADALEKMLGIVR